MLHWPVNIIPTFFDSLKNLDGPGARRAAVLCFDDGEQQQEARRSVARRRVARHFSSHLQPFSGFVDRLWRRESTAGLVRRRVPEHGE